MVLQPSLLHLNVMHLLKVVQGAGGLLTEVQEDTLVVLGRDHEMKMRTLSRKDGLDGLNTASSDLVLASLIQSHVVSSGLLVDAPEELLLGYFG